MISKRVLKILLWVLAIGLTGGFYYMFVSVSGLAIPCLFYVVTGWKCPGCGVTRMMLALLRGDWKTAFGWHPMLMLQIPFLLGVSLRVVMGYIRTGKWKTCLVDEVILWVCIALLIVFTIYRNIGI